jgi:hypothetical protein
MMPFTSGTASTEIAFAPVCEALLAAAGCWAPRVWANAGRETIRPITSAKAAQKMNLFFIEFIPFK